MNGKMESTRLQPPVRRSASISSAHMKKPAHTTCAGAPPNSQPSSAALRMWSIR